MQYIFCYLSLIVSVLLFIIVLIKCKKEKEKFYYLHISLYYLISNVLLIKFPFPLGFFVCLINLISHHPVKNEKAKIIIIVLGLCTSFLLFFVPKPWNSIFII